MRYLVSTFLILSLTLLASCSKDLPEDYIKRGELAAKQQDYASSVIELKSAAIQYPDNARVRYLLATYYQKTGDVPGATKELYRALDLNYTASDAVPQLLTLLGLQELNEEIIELADRDFSDTPEVDDILAIYKALALFKLEQKTEAMAQLTQAIDKAKNSKYKSIGQAYLYWYQDNTERAMKSIDAALNSDEDMIEALTVKAQILLVQGKNEAALVPLRKLYKNPMKSNFVDILLANTYMQLNDFDNAKKHINYLVSFFPEIAYAQQLKGILEFKLQNYELAKIHSEKAIQTGGDNSAGRVLAGLSNYHLENFEQANRHFSAAGKEALVDKAVSTAYAITQLKLGSYEQAKESFLSLADLTSDDAKLFSFAGEQLLGAGFPTDARKLLNIAGSLNAANDDEKERFRQGILGLKLSDLDAIKNLEELVAENTKYPQASYALANYYLRNDEIEKAIALGEKLKQERPKQVDGFEISGFGYLKSENNVQAKENFLQVLKFDKNNTSALLYLASESAAEKKFDSSAEFLERLLDAQPRHINALTKYFEVSLVNNQREKAISRIKAAYNLDQGAIVFRILYAQALAKTNTPDEVIKLLSVVTANKSTPPLYFITLGDSYMVSGLGESAVELYEKWMKIQPNQQFSYVKAINTYEQLEQFDKSLELSLTAAKKFPEQAIFNLLVVHFRILNNEYKKAQVVLNSLPSDITNSISAKGLQGQIWLKQGRVKEALPMLLDFYDQSPSFIRLTHVIDSYAALGLSNESISFIEKHLESFENDILSRMLLADVLVWTDPARAVNEYQMIVKENNKNAYAWNNLAWLMYVQNEYTQAEEFASNALNLLPQDPDILDTYGMILLKLGEKNKALSFIEQAFKTKSNSMSIYFHYAEALILNDRKQEAYRLLDKISSKDDSIIKEIGRLKAI